MFKRLPTSILRSFFHLATSQTSWMKLSVQAECSKSGLAVAQPISCTSELPRIMQWSELEGTSSSKQGYPQVNQVSQRPIESHLEYLQGWVSHLSPCCPGRFESLLNNWNIAQCIGITGANDDKSLFVPTQGRFYNDH